MSAIERCAENLREVEEDIKEALVKAEVLHQDETVLYVVGVSISKREKSTLSRTGYATDFCRWPPRRI